MQQTGKRTQNSIRNVKWSMVAYAAKFTASFFFRMAFVRLLGELYAGVDGAFATIVAILELLELGNELAVTYLLYGPIVRQDVGEISRILRYHKKAAVGTAVLILLAAGICLPLLPVLVPDLPALPQLPLIFLLMISRPVAEFLARPYRAFVCAQQKQYVYTLSHYLSGALIDLLQIGALLLTRSYLLCLLLQTAGILLEVWAERRYIKLHYGKVFAPPAWELPDARRVTAGKVRRNAMSVMLHKVGDLIVRNIDTLFVARIGGVVMGGMYFNYKYIVSALEGVYKVLMNSIAASVGDLGARAHKARSAEVFPAVQLAGAWLYGMSAVCLYVLMNPFVTLWLGESSLLSMPVVALLCLQFFVNGNKQAVQVYRDALGLFSADKWIPALEAGLYLLLGLIACELQADIAAVPLAGALAALFTAGWFTPVMLHRRGFGTGAVRYFLRYGAYTLCVVLGCGLAWWLANRPGWGGIGGFLWQMGVCAVVPNALFLLCFGRTAAGKLLLSKLGTALHRKKK